MPYALIVAETNPLHFGHTYLIQRAKSDGYSVIVLMSGAFTQRGLPVVTDKFTRAKDLIKNGVDLVLTHPVQSATSYGEMFSYGAMCVATRLPSIDAIYCGTEFGDEDIFHTLFLYEQTNAFQKRLKENLNKGSSYATAYKEALAQKEPAWIRVFQSNALLAYGYYKSLKKQSSSIPLITIPRKENPAFMLSASAIRALNDCDAPNLNNYCVGTKPQYKEGELSEALFRLYRGIFRTAAVDLTNLDGYEAGLDLRLKKLFRSSINFNDFMEHAKTKRYSQWRIARLLLHGLLSMNREVIRTSLERQKIYQVLAFSKKGTEYLRLAKSSSTSLLTNFKQIRQFSPDQQQMLAYEEKATDLWSVLTATEMGRDYFGK